MESNQPFEPNNSLKFIHHAIKTGLETSSSFDLLTKLNTRQLSNRLSSTIHSNVEFVHSQYRCIITSRVSTVICVQPIINNSDNKVIIL